MKLQSLQFPLGEAADTLRGTTVDRTGWKGSILSAIGYNIPSLPNAVTFFRDAFADHRTAENQLQTVPTEGSCLR